jgi:hypothetical protein
MKIAQIMMEEKIKHAEEQSLMQESGRPSPTVCSVTLETTFTPEPQHSLHTFVSSFPTVHFPN